MQPRDAYVPGGNNLPQRRCRWEGCQIVLPIQELGSHELSCECRRVPCSLGCNEAVPVRALMEHAFTSCRKAKSLCWQGCGMQVERAELSQHLENVCTKTLVVCPVPGCNSRTQRQDMPRHMATALLEHARLTNSKIVELESRLLHLETQLTQNKIFINQQEEAIRRQEAQLALSNSSNSSLITTTRGLNEDFLSSSIVSSSPSLNGLHFGNGSSLPALPSHSSIDSFHTSSMAGVSSTGSNGINGNKFSGSADGSGAGTVSSGIITGAEGSNGNNFIASQVCGASVNALAGSLPSVAPGNINNNSSGNAIAASVSAVSLLDAERHEDFSLLDNISESDGPIDAQDIPSGSRLHLMSGRRFSVNSTGTEQLSADTTTGIDFSRLAQEQGVEVLVATLLLHTTDARAQERGCRVLRDLAANGMSWIKLNWLHKTILV